MCDAIRHRGPDDWGTFVEGGVGLGMRRLSIIDLAGGHQPIGERGRQRAGRLQRRDLQLRGAAHASWWRKGHRFRTRSDTEVLVHLYEEHGERMLQRLRGMFAFAIWDRRRRRLLLARDHFGQKPLFYTERGGRLTFASEIKALLARRSHRWRAVSRRARPVPHPPVRPAARHVLRRGFARCRRRTSWSGRTGASRIERYWDLELRPQVDLLRGRDCSSGSTSCSPKRSRLHLTERRAGGRVPERRARLDADRLLRRQGAGLGAAHLLDGHSRIGT